MRRRSIVSATLCWLALAAAQPAPVALDVLLADEPAPTLAAYRLFTDARGREPNARVTPYTLNTPLFSDYAAKHRYVFVPPGKTIGYRAQGVLDFPVGTTLVKTFAYPADLRAPGANERFLETRLLIRKAQGWVALPYVWNADGTEAALKKAGAKLDASWVHTDGQPRQVRWSVPNVNQCKGCHASAEAVTPIGPKAWNLGQAQLASWTKLGLIAGVSNVPKVPAWNDPGAPVAIRARAYLDVNCAHCHHAKGPASNSGLFLEWDQPDRVAYGVGKRPVAAGRGTGGHDFAIAPGHPDRSILVYRMASAEPGVMMPELGRTMTDEEGLALVRAYIAGLKPRR
jgi:uncharacterized repeat protein (TIGR03806 family)